MITKQEYSIAKDGKRIGRAELSENEVKKLLKLGYKKMEGKILCLWT